MKKPDWSKAPEWAYWWAVDENGKAYWYPEQPSVYDDSGRWDKGEYCEYAGDDALGPKDAWRSTLRHRSESTL